MEVKLEVEEPDWDELTTEQSESEVEPATEHEFHTEKISFGNRACRLPGHWPMTGVIDTPEQHAWIQMMRAFISHLPRLLVSRCGPLMLNTYVVAFWLTAGAGPSSFASSISILSLPSMCDSCVAWNSSTAGMLALLKGQGPPDRLRKDEFEMRKVQDFIEQMEARLAFIGEDISEKELDDPVK